ncbi:hypothetical protein [Ancrocorticia populi]|uniref:hypothetical protein n=1 Tax=Ancrocorticia populi TaxID=2175228 RepID=UPI003F9A3EB1
MAKKIVLTAFQFDHRSGSGYTRHRRGDVFDIEDSTAARLIRVGAAKLAEESIEEEQEAGESLNGASVEDSEPPAEDSSEEEQEEVEAEEEFSRPAKAANVTKWRAYAKHLGIDTANKSKDEIIALVGGR